MHNPIQHLLQQQQIRFTPVVKSTPETMQPIDLSASNTLFTESVYTNATAFTQFIKQYLLNNGVKFAFGGYNEIRNMYKRSAVFDTSEALQKPRRLHLGVDVWGPEGTPVYAPLEGIVHSTGFNNKFGDYGATILLEHHINNFRFFTLYGHCSKADLLKLEPERSIKQGSIIGHFGNWEENGNWPPHLHFQLIIDLQQFTGDYPGVCAEEEKEFYLNNCPDATFFLF